MNRLASDVGRQAVVLVAATVLAAAIMAAMPGLRAWVRRQLP